MQIEQLRLLIESCFGQLRVTPPIAKGADNGLYLRRRVYTPVSSYPHSKIYIYCYALIQLPVFSLAYYYYYYCYFRLLVLTLYVLMAIGGHPYRTQDEGHGFTR